MRLTDKYIKSDGYYDTHHILKKQICLRNGLNPDIKYNMLIIRRNEHSILHGAENNAIRRKLAESVYHYLLIELNDLNLNDEDYFNVKTLYKYCTIKAWNKTFFQENFEEIVAGYKKLEEINKEIFLIFNKKGSKWKN